MCRKRLGVNKINFKSRTYHHVQIIVRSVTNCGDVVSSKVKCSRLAISIRSIRIQLKSNK